jgi:hypothetical protein
MTCVDSAGATGSEGEGLWGGGSLRGRAKGEAITEGVDIAVAVALSVGTGLGDGGLGVARAVEAGVGVEIMAEGAVVIGLALTAAAIADGAVLEVLDGRGFTKVFDGASGGGETSAFIFARARSAAGRSVSAAQLFSTVASVMVSFTFCGRSTPGTAVIAGADITSTSPRTLGGAFVSEFTCRSRRYRSMGCWLRERISS